MSSLVIPDVEETLLARLRARASAHQRTLEVEAKAILAEVLQPAPVPAWAGVNALRQRLAASGRSFGDSTELLREDRER